MLNQSNDFAAKHIFKRLSLPVFTVGIIFATVSSAYAVPSDGSPDLAFGQSGKVNTVKFPPILLPVPSNSTEVNGMTIDSLNRLIVVGSANRDINDPWLSPKYCMVARYLPDGSLDTSFNANGAHDKSMSYVLDVPANHKSGIIDLRRNNVDNGSDDCVLSRVVTEPGTDKIIAVGTTNNSLFATHLWVVRLNADGSPDTSFAGTGIFETAINGDDTMGFNESLALQADGKIVVSGTALAWPMMSPYLMRINTNGTLDNTFGAGGIALLNLPGGSDGMGSAVTLQPDGKIILTGSNGGFGSNELMLARYNTNGTLDTTFGINGIVVSDPQGGACSTGYKTILQGSQLLVAGTSCAPASDRGMTVFRFNANGTLDTAFGSGGLFQLAVAGVDLLADSVALQSDGNIVAAGTSGSQPMFRLIRLLPDGTLDSTFGINGIVDDIDQGVGSTHAMLIQPDDKIVVSGNDFDKIPGNSPAQIGLARFAFGNHGSLTGDDYQRNKTHADVTAYITAGKTPEQSDRSINGVFVAPLKDRSKNGSVFIFGYLPETIAFAPNTVWVFDSAHNWHLFTDCRIAPAFFVGELGVIDTIPIVAMPSDLSMLSGAELYIGYGLGGHTSPSGQACNDMVAQQNWVKVYTAP